MDYKFTLQPDEVVLYEAHTGNKKSYYIIAAILTLIPPFIWGILFFLFLSWRKKRKGNRIILTNERLIISGIADLSGSLYLGDIKRIAVNGLGLFGVQDVVFKLKGKMLPRSIHDVKDSRTLVKKVREAIKES